MAPTVWRQSSEVEVKVLSFRSKTTSKLLVKVEGGLDTQKINIKGTKRSEWSINVCYTISLTVGYHHIQASTGGGDHSKCIRPGSWCPCQNIRSWVTGGCSRVNKLSTSNLLFPLQPPPSWTSSRLAPIFVLSALTTTTLYQTGFKPRSGTLSFKEDKVLCLSLGDVHFPFRWVILPFWYQVA